LRKGTSGTLLVLVPDFGNPFHSDVVAGIESVTRQHGVHLLLADAGEMWMRGDVGVEAIYSRLSDGVISLAPMPSDSDLSLLIPDIPWVACSEFLPEFKIPYASINHRKAACDAVQYLINRGHRRIALINSDERLLYARQRRAGYEDALLRAGLEIDPGLIRMTGMRGPDFAHGSQAATDLLTVDRPPTAVFAISDRLAIGAIKTFRRAGMRVPEDVAVMGFDNSAIADVFEPGLSTVDQPTRALGAAAAEMLLQRLHGEHPASRTLAHQVVLRESA
jgi:DNA-binding LacI/PurR family transcriptional regulator